MTRLRYLLILVNLQVIELRSSLQIHIYTHAFYYYYLNIYSGDRETMLSSCEVTTFLLPIISKCCSGFQRKISKLNNAKYWRKGIPFHWASTHFLAISPQHSLMTPWQYWIWPERNPLCPEEQGFQIWVTQYHLFVEGKASCFQSHLITCYTGNSQGLNKADIRAHRSILNIIIVVVIIIKA